MTAHIQRWFLLITALVFIAVGCLNLTEAFDGPLVFGQAAAGLFYFFVGGCCMWKHVSDVAGDWNEDEQPGASWRRSLRD